MPATEYRQPLSAFLSILLFAVIALLSAPVAHAEKPQAGVDYLVVDPPQPVRVPEGKIEVVEFFNYSCPHCFRLQGYFARWQAENDADDIEIIHQPVAFSNYRGHFARAYYTLQGLGIEDEYSDKLYDAIHVERMLLNSRGRFLNWLEEQGIDEDKAAAVYDSFTVNSRANRAETIAADYDINSTPQLAVAGKYVLNPSLSGSYEEMFETLTALIEMERAQTQ